MNHLKGSNVMALLQQLSYANADLWVLRQKIGESALIQSRNGVTAHQSDRVWEGTQINLKYHRSVCNF